MGVIDHFGGKGSKREGKKSAKRLGEVPLRSERGVFVSGEKKRKIFGVGREEGRRTQRGRKKDKQQRGNGGVMAGGVIWTGKNFHKKGRAPMGGGKKMAPEF